MTGRKDDEGKLRYDLVPAYAFERLVEVYTIGAKKYADWNWAKGLNWSRVFAAVERHLAAWKRGEETDPVDGQLHLASAAWGCLTLIEYGKIRQDMDDRFSSEEWLVVPDAEGYEVSDEGRLRKGELFLKPQEDRGYRYFNAYKDGRRKRYYVHRAVLAAFVRPLQDGEVVNHRNGNRADNRLVNLEILDAAGNILDAYRRGRARVRPGETSTKAVENVYELAGSSSHAVGNPHPVKDAAHGYHEQPSHSTISLGEGKMVCEAFIEDDATGYK